MKHKTNFDIFDKEEDREIERMIDTSQMLNWILGILIVLILVVGIVLRVKGVI